MDEMGINPDILQKMGYNISFSKSVIYTQSDKNWKSI